LGTPLHISFTAGSFKAVFGRLVSRLHPGGFLQYNFTAAVNRKVNGRARQQLQRITNLLGYGDLAFISQGCRHGASSKKITTTSYLSNIHPTSNSKRHYF
jgi:hypothetical protein